MYRSFNNLLKKLNLIPISLFLEFDTYELFTNQTKKPYPFLCRVKNDSSKNLLNTIYIVFPDSTIIWIAATHN